MTDTLQKRKMKTLRYYATKAYNPKDVFKKYIKNKTDPKEKADFMKEFLFFCI